jgi:hypothetical protein
MATIILYVTDKDHTNKILDEIIDRTDPDLVEEVVVCCDQDLELESRPKVSISKQDSGPIAAFDKAIGEAKSEDIILLKGCVKVKEGWTEGLIDVEDKTLASPITHVLDTNHWSTQDRCMRRYGYRWDMSLYDRPDPSHSISPSASPTCVAFKKATYDWLGGFDLEMRSDEPGEILELSIKTWMMGGQVVIAEKSRVAAPELSIPAKHNNSARIVEKWFENYSSHFYNRQGLDPNSCHIGKLNGDAKKRTVESDDYLRSKMPELLSIYKLREFATGKSVAIVGTGPSVDMINPAEVYRHDLIIGVDYIGMLFQCDFMTTFDAQIVVALREHFADNNFILPLALHNRTTSEMVSANEVAEDAIVCELARPNDSVSSIHPPFANFDNAALFAAHLALFLGARSITLFGVDNKIIGEKSHTSKIDYYDDGKLWADSDAVRREFARYEYGLDMLGRLAHSNGVPILRVNHV